MIDPGVVAAWRVECSGKAGVVAVSGCARQSQSSYRVSTTKLLWGLLLIGDCSLQNELQSASDTVGYSGLFCDWGAPGVDPVTGWVRAAARPLG